MTFEGIVGSPYTGDLAIDDVSIANGGCQGSTTTPSTSNSSTQKPVLHATVSTVNPSSSNQPLGISAFDPFSVKPSLSSLRLPGITHYKSCLLS